MGQPSQNAWPEKEGVVSTLMNKASRCTRLTARRVTQTPKNAALCRTTARDIEFLKHIAYEIYHSLINDLSGLPITILYTIPLKSCIYTRTETDTPISTSRN